MFSFKIRHSAFLAHLAGEYNLVWVECFLSHFITALTVLWMNYGNGNLFKS